MEDRDAYEKEVTKTMSDAKAHAQLLVGVDKDKALQYMHAFRVASFNDVLAKAGDWVSRLNKHAIEIVKVTLRPAGTGTVVV